MSTLQTTGDRIRAARKRAHLTQAELAELVHVHRDTVSNWETGKHPPGGAWPLIEDALGITLRETDEQVPAAYTLEALLDRLRAAEREIDNARAIARHLMATD